MLSSWLKSLRLSAGWLPTLRPSQLTWAVSLPKIGSCHPRPPLQLSLLLSYICQIFCTQPLRPAVVVCLWFSNGQSIDDDNDDEDDDDDVQLPDFSVSLTSLTHNTATAHLHTRRLLTTSEQQGTKVRRYNWHSAVSLGWPFPMLKCNFFSDKIYGSGFIKQHSETVMVWNYQNADCIKK